MSSLWALTFGAHYLLAACNQTRNPSVGSLRRRTEPAKQSRPRRVTLVDDNSCCYYLTPYLRPMRIHAVSEVMLHG